MDEIDAPPRRNRRRVAIALVALVGAGLLALWLARVPIATGFIDRKLAEKRVPARYRVADLGFGRQRLTDVVIGDPAHPDLVADWIETHVDIGAYGPKLAAVRAGHVRLRARLVDGRITLGTIDRLLPAPTGAPFSLPDIAADLADVRVRLETPYGVVGARLEGAGGLHRAFNGRLAAASARLAAGDCVATGPTAFLALGVKDGAPTIRGPVRIPMLNCAGATARGTAATLDVALSRALDRWRGSAAMQVDAIADAGADAGAGTGARARAVGGRMTFAGTAARTEGRADLASGAFAGGGVAGERLAFLGTWRVAGGRPIVAGRVSAEGAALEPGMRRRIASLSSAGAGTPVGPIAAALARAAGQAAARFDAQGELAVAGGGLATLRSIVATSASGARMTLGDGAGVVIGDPAGVRVDGTATLAGGGFPDTRVALTQPRAGAAITGRATIAPYAAGGAVGGARLALAPVVFSAGEGATTVRTTMALSGPLADGRVEGLRLPIVARIAGSDVTVNAACAPLAFDRLAVGGVRLTAARVTLCPTGRALIAVRGDRVDGGALIAAPRLTGTIGSSPLTLAAASAEVTTRGFAIAGLETRIGAPASQTRLDFARLDGRFADGIAGSFAGGKGQIGNVPLLLGEAAGDWRFARGVLEATAATEVTDAAAPARFEKLAARDVTLRLADNVITAQGTLQQPAKGIKVADVTIRHALGPGTGTAHLAVPGITFGDALQPEELTRLTFGVIADVKGKVTGEGDIAWSPAGVTSTGTFATDGTDLAAAFGPVTGIKGTIRFTDLLNLESAPNQVATIASVNPGVAVNDGRITYQTLAGTRVKVNGGRWPFAGGTLTLEPTLLDFSAAQSRRLTFLVDGMRADEFLQQFDFKNIDATGIFDGALPMVFDDSGGRIENGKLVARESGGGIAYVGDLTEKDLGTWGNIAFQALKSLRYRNLDIVMNGPLAGEMITEVRFAGVSQGEGAKSNFLIRRLQRLPFVFNIRIKAPFRGLLDSAASFYDPKRLIQRNLPALLEQQEKAAPPPAATPSIQPPASEKMP